MNCSISAKATISSNLRRISASLHAEDRRRSGRCFHDRSIRVGAGADFQQAADSAIDVHFAGRRLRDPAQEFQEGAFPRSIAADHPTTSPRFTSKDTSFNAQNWFSSVAIRRFNIRRGNPARPVSASRNVPYAGRVPMRYCFPNPSTRIAMSLMRAWPVLGQMSKVKPVLSKGQNRSKVKGFQKCRNTNSPIFTNLYSE